MSVLPVIAASWIAGVALGLAVPASPWSLAAAAPLGLLGALAALRAGRGLAWVCLATVFCLGWCRPAQPSYTAVLPPDPAPCPRLIEGRVARAPLPLEDGHRLIIEIERCSECLAGPRFDELRPARGTLHLTVSGEREPRLRGGDRVRLRASMRPFHHRANLPGPHPALILDRFGARLTRPAGIQRIERAPSGPVRAFFEEKRLAAGAFWHTALPPAQARLARALSLGESRALEPEQREAFRRTGTAHLFAVSGLHLGLVVLLVFAAARFGLLLLPPLARSTDPGRMAAVLAIPAAVGFALLTGARPSVMRACVMAVAALGARALGRPASAPSAIALAAAALTLWEPEDLARPGFQLSFAAALAFVALLRPAGRGLAALEGDVSSDVPGPGALRRLLIRGRDLLRACVAASAATSPIALIHFGGFSAIAVPSNFLLLPVAATLLPALLAISLLSGPLPEPARVAAAAAGPLLAGIEDLARALSTLPAVLAPAGRLPVAAVFGFCAAVLSLLARRPRLAGVLAAPAVVLLAVGLWLSPPPVSRDRLTLDVLDVGQGQAALITFPTGRRWLVDAGTDTVLEERAGRVLVPALRALGVRALDVLLLTHPHPDHLVAGKAALDRFGANAVWDNGQGAAEGAHPSHQALLERAHERGVPVLGMPEVCGEREVDGVRVAVLHPCHDPEGFDPTLSFNENSIVLHLTHGRVRMMLTGDLGAEGEEIMLEREAALPSDLLVLGHHGSSTSSTPAFLDALSPAVAVASCGPFNRYGMPHAQVRRALARRSIRLFRTDLDGAVRAVSDGRVLAVSAARRRPR